MAHAASTAQVASKAFGARQAGRAIASWTKMPAINSNMRAGPPKVAKPVAATTPSMAKNRQRQARLRSRRRSALISKAISR